MMKSAILWLWFLAAFASPGIAEEFGGIYDPPYKKPTELARGSELRGALFDKLRAKTKKEVLFEGSLKAYRNWALFTGRTVDRAGKSVAHPPLGNDDAVGLWIRTRDGWTVVDYSFGHSDVFYLIWVEQYGVPKELLGMGG